MTRETALQSLENSLRETIDDWFDENQDKRSNEMEALRYFGSDVTLLMARAAMLVIRATQDVQDQLKSDGVIAER